MTTEPTAEQLMKLTEKYKVCEELYPGVTVTYINIDVTGFTPDKTSTINGYIFFGKTLVTATASSIEDFEKIMDALLFIKVSDEKGR